MYILCSLFITLKIIYITVNVFAPFSIRKSQTYRECSDNKPDIKNKTSFWTAFELLIYFIQCVYYLCKCGILGTLKTVLALIISSTIYSYIFILIHYTYVV